MPIKGLFNQKQNHEILLEKIAELEKKQRRLNEIEVQIKRLLKMEEDVASLLKVKGELKNTSIPKKPIQEAKNKRKGREEPYLAEASIIKKITPFIKAVGLMDKQITELEKHIARIHQSQANIYHRLDEIEAKLSGFQTDMEEKDKKTSINKPTEQAVVIKEIRIDKFYLDKYEQNNNFGQLGIKELSGALNIGATFGREVIPKEISDQIKEDMEGFADLKKDFAKGEAEEESSSVDESVSEESETFTEIPIEVISDDE
ncbi:hypothetical protein [Lederbergia citrea]|uniref:Uncharacterized protein n=1 Tax=Lederbergia citrea TaxID=2833581 RepID=A0A942Z412_9BACI|nr:hypothetical protein [Lederbergia citrea]MBS4178315.1 hypothetical protein [Lederbergia citrea]MBS4204991.1 hypothetical protein [Lederbergia citrea]MBS4223154.1 hypothetical protein [Lederbergia citrea]